MYPEAPAQARGDGDSKCIVRGRMFIDVSVDESSKALEDDRVIGDCGLAGTFRTREISVESQVWGIRGRTREGFALAQVSCADLERGFILCRRSMRGRLSALRRR